MLRTSTAFNHEKMRHFYSTEDLPATVYGESGNVFISQCGIADAIGEYAIYSSLEWRNALGWRVYIGATGAWWLNGVGMYSGHQYTSVNADDDPSTNPWTIVDTAPAPPPTVILIP